MTSPLVPTPRLALVIALASAGCAARQAPAPRDCAPEWDRVERTLRAGLDDYVSGLDRYVAAAIPDRTTTAARARAAAAADAWATRHREPFLTACPALDAAARRCLLAATDARDLSACGQGALVTSFTDDVLPAYTADPLDPVPPAGGPRSRSAPFP